MISSVQMLAVQLLGKVMATINNTDEAVLTQSGARNPNEKNRSKRFKQCKTNEAMETEWNKKSKREKKKIEMSQVIQTM